MRFSCKLIKDDKFWLVDIPIIDAMTQGCTKEEAYEMAIDLIETFINESDFKATIHIGPNDTFEISGSDPQKMEELVLKRKNIHRNVKIYIGKQNETDFFILEEMLKRANIKYVIEESEEEINLCIIPLGNNLDDFCLLFTKEGKLDYAQAF